MIRNTVAVAMMLAVVVVAVPTFVFAQDAVPVPAPQDHLLCFNVETDTEVKASVRLHPQQLFRNKGRVGPRMIRFCVPTHKRVIDLIVAGAHVNPMIIDARPTRDFDCYPYESDIPRFKVRVKDQFTGQVIKTTGRMQLCAPSKKTSEIVFEVDPVPVR